MQAWAVVAHGAPLECVELPDPVPVGSEIMVEVTQCGVCHSDLHLWHGGYDLGGGKMLSVKDRGLLLPAAPGHEIVGRVTRLGPDASGVAVGDVRVVYPWVGCGPLRPVPGGGGQSLHPATEPGRQREWRVRRVGEGPA